MAAEGGPVFWIRNVCDENRDRNKGFFGRVPRRPRSWKAPTPQIKSLKLSPPPPDIYSRGIDVSIVSGNDAAFDLLGQTPQQISQGIPEYFRILHIESVVRGDLYVDFLTRKKELRKELLERQLSDLRRSTPLKSRAQIRGGSVEKEMLVDGLLTPHLTFHGTRRDLVSSIICHGFLLPGDRVPLSNTNTSIRCASGVLTTRESTLPFQPPSPSRTPAEVPTLPLRGTTVA